MIFAASLVLIITAVYVLGKPYYHTEFAKAEVNEEVVSEAANIDALSVQTSSANVKIVPDTADTITVRATGMIDKKLKGKYRLKTKENGSVLNIKYLTNENTVGIKFGSEKDINIHVTVPKKVYRELAVSTTSGNIEVENISAHNFKSKTTSGEQNIREIETEDALSIHTTSGDVKLTRNSVKFFSIDSTSGNVETEALNCENGKIHITSGTVKMKQSSEFKELDIGTTSGDVEMAFEKNPESLKIDFQGDSGKPSIELQDVMYKDKGKNFAKGIIGNGANALKVKTTSGDLAIR
ncbi:DUF4097 family beta strand repeat-containing protein [Mesobacillus zeae]|nr:DUF4097 family beta strand repeat-containing protein [Mesobacillus zeae]